MNRVVCFDIGGTSVKYALIENGKIKCRGRFATNRENGKDVLGEMVRVVNEYKEQDAVDGVSISSPGFV